MNLKKMFSILAAVLLSSSVMLALPTGVFAASYMPSNVGEYGYLADDEPATETTSTEPPAPPPPPPAPTTTITTQELPSEETTITTETEPPAPTTTIATPELPAVEATITSETEPPVTNIIETTPVLPATVATDPQPVIETVAVPEQSLEVSGALPVNASPAPINGAPATLELVPPSPVAPAPAGPGAPPPGPPHPPFPPRPPHPILPWNYSWVWPAHQSEVIIYQSPVVYPPVIGSFTANPNYIQPGELTTLTWSVSNADIISISPNVGSVASSGTFAVTPYYTTTYTLTATNSSGAVSASTTVTIASVAVVSTYGTYGTGTGMIDIPTSSTTGSTVNTSGVTTGSAATNLWLMYLLLIGLLAIAAAVIVALLVRRPAASLSTSPTGTQGSYAAIATATASMLPETAIPVTRPVEAGLPAKFVSDHGITMPITGRSLGRKDFKALTSPDKADLISRQHFLVTYENSQYFIEDLGSTNGTRLNGADIKGGGKHSIENGDTVELAGTLTLTFKV